MMQSKTSCMPLFEIMGRLHGEKWYALMLKISLQVNLYMTQKDHIFIVDVMVIKPTQETMVLNVITQPTCVVIELSVIIKVCKYKRFHKGHHFISMAMEVHDTPMCDMNHFIRVCACLFHDRLSRAHLFLSFSIQFSRQRVSIVL
jgi:hypothetical protein